MRDQRGQNAIINVANVNVKDDLDITCISAVDDFYKPELISNDDD